MMQTAPHSAAHPFGALPASRAASSPPLFVLPSRRRRRVAPDQGRALEKLAHAIEYLADELTLECMTAAHKDFQPHSILTAIEMLKQCNREIYLACPQQPTFAERLRTWFTRGSDAAHLPIGN